MNRTRYQVVAIGHDETQAVLFSRPKRDGAIEEAEQVANRAYIPDVFMIGVFDTAEPKALRGLPLQALTVN